MHLLARPGEITAEELALVTGGEPAPYSPYGVHLEPGSGDIGELDAVREGLAVVQDEGSQLVALALTRVPVDDDGHRWLDLCAGPGGKSALLGGLLALEGGTLDAVEPAEHRAELVRRAVDGLPVTVHVADGRTAPLPDGGLRPGAGRRAVHRPGRPAPAARGAVAAPAGGRGRAVAAAARAARRGAAARAPGRRGGLRHLLAAPGGDRGRGGGRDAPPRQAGGRRSEGIAVEQLDARPYLPGVPELGPGPSVQLWPHRHGTDAMFLALLRRTR